MNQISVACLDMAGTTVSDSGTVMAAFTEAIAAQKLQAHAFDEAMTYAGATMGRSKIEVFRHIFADEDTAQRANAAFESSYAQTIRDGKVEPMPGAADLFAACRTAGIKICLSTGFSPATRDAVISALGWHGLIDLAISPADAGRGRPWPDMPLTALLRLHGGSVSELAVVGDTPSDIESGLRAGAGLVAGVLTGGCSRAELAAVPAAAGLPGSALILDSVADLYAHLGG